MTTVVGLTVLLLSCAPNPGGLRATPQGDGPRVYIDWDADPLPELPFPNDLAARPDPTSPTGLRLNFSLDSSTTMEREAREKVNTLTGFGIYAPISVRFDAPLDLDVIAAAHANDLDPVDDLFFVIDVTPGSKTFGELVDLDVGHGRYPADVVQTDRYFRNDPRASEPSIMFDTVDEDLDGDGVLDPGEDTDNDGYLDVANVYPLGGDPRDDLLTWYERLTDTLIFRPVVPLREETTYAVVLSERLIGEDGNPVRSPWDFVHHLRQTEALRPLVDILPDYGFTIDEVGFAWTFTTGRITGDLVDIRRGLYGEGPFSFLEDEVPAGVFEASVMYDRSDADNIYTLPILPFYNMLSTLGVFDSVSDDIIRPGFEMTEHMVGGAFYTPDLLFDKDDGGRDTSDEAWTVDVVRREVEYENLRVVFTCIVPKEDETYQQPFPVTIYGHGYGSSRFEFVSLVGWSSAQAGIATCAIDYPAHGISIPSDIQAQMDTVFRPAGYVPFIEHLQDNRARDLDNDGVDDSGADQWTSEAFHTRDQVRQGALDMMSFVRALRQCGTGTMGVDVNGDGTEETSCDWDGNGVPDIGGPDVDYFFSGGSLGGIVTSVAAAVEPHVKASVNIVSGGGLFDIGTRSNIGGAVEALQGRLWGPFILGTPDPGTGGWIIEQQVNSAFMDMVSVPIAALPAPPIGGVLEVRNLKNDEVQRSTIRANGLVRAAVPSDALMGIEKAMAVGIPESGPEEGVRYVPADNTEIGDPLEILIYDVDGQLVKTINTFEVEVTFEAVTFEEGSPLVAVGEGLGHIRSSPEHRRIVSALSMVTEPGDPIAYASHYVLEPFEELHDGPLNVLQINTVGDEIVMINASIAQARAMGIWDLYEVDPRYNMSIDDYLIDRRVVHGLEEFGPYVDVNGAPALFDVDDSDNGVDPIGAPSDTPLRVTYDTSSGQSGLRLPYASSRGSHGMAPPNSSLAWDWGSFVINQAIYYVHTGGQEISDDPCLADNSCTWIRNRP